MNQSNKALRDEVLAVLKHVYFDSTTDNVAVRTGVAPNRNHALPILEHKTDDILALVTNHIKGALPEKTDLFKDMDINDLEGESKQTYIAWAREQGRNKALDEVHQLLEEVSNADQ